MPTIITRGAMSAKAFGFGGAVAAAVGQDTYTVPGTYTWVKPAGVTSVSIVAVGGGGGGGTGTIAGCYPTCYCSYAGGGGAGSPLTYSNNMSVTSYSSLTIVVGAGGNADTNGSTSQVKTCGGASIFTSGYGGAGSTTARGVSNAPTGSYTSTYAGGSGGLAQKGVCSIATRAGGGGGAGGYSGAGGTGGCSGTNGGVAGTGGAGGGGGTSLQQCRRAGGGGGVGLLGLGTSGAAGGTAGVGGGGGSGGSNGTSAGVGCVGGCGGAYGGGGAGGGSSYRSGAPGAGGAVRIIYPGATRSFPSTCTGNL